MGIATARVVIYAGLLLAAVVSSSDATSAEPRTFPSETRQVTGREHELIEISIVPMPPAGFEVLSQDWLVVDERLSWRQYEGGSVLVCTAPPGTYTVRWRIQYVDWEAREGQSASRVYTISVEGARPPPDVDPEPDPIEPPPGNRLVVVVYESSQAAVPLPLYSAAQRLRELGHQVRIVDQDVETGEGQVPREVARAIEAAQDAGSFPVLVVSSLGGEVIRTLPLPQTAEEIVEAVR